MEAQRAGAYLEEPIAYRGVSSMNQAVAVPSASSRALRLVLVFFGAVLGLLVLSFVFGSSSASADDGDGLLGSFTEAVDEVTEPVQATVTQTVQAVQAVTQSEPVATATAPIVAVVDSTVNTVVEPTILGDALGTTPVGSLLDPVTTVIDDALAGAVDTVGPVVGVIETVTVLPVFATDAAAAAITSVLSFALSPTVIGGVATGVLDLRDSALASGGVGLSSSSGSGLTLFAAVAGMGFLALLAMRRHALTYRAMPGSPVYETDSSPD
jgi:hypothetical protein